jgi:hypothetical protein
MDRIFIQNHKKNMRGIDGPVYFPFKDPHQLEKNAYYIKLADPSILENNATHVLYQKEALELWKYAPIRYMYLGEKYNKDADNIDYIFQNLDENKEEIYDMSQIYSLMDKYPFFRVSNEWRNNSPEINRLKKQVNETLSKTHDMPIADRGFSTPHDMARVMMGKATGPRISQRKGGSKKKTTKKRSCSKNKKIQKTRRTRK